MLNALTVDVEDYFQVNAFAKIIHRHDWDRYPLRVDDNTRRVLDLFDEYDVKATFFVLGWIAERVPGLAKEILNRGHEVACHGYGHELVFEIGPQRFKEDIRRGKSILEDQTGCPVLGYRAPSYSITKRSLWALDLLQEAGFTYDSSIFPVLHDTYGIPDAERFPHQVVTGSGELVEFPLTTLPIRFGWKRFSLPIAGGGYLRLLPVGIIRRGISVINQKEQHPAVLYFHPWELDPQQPRVRVGLKSRFRHYTNLAKTHNKLKVLLAAHKFGTMSDVIAGLPELKSIAYGV
jgi:polysaccharide deacetylase family protein (PEP-CTERM system associated)